MTRCDCHGGRVFGDLLYGDTTTTICEKCNGTGYLPDAGNQLFKDRVPEAAARQLATVLAWATECQLATVEHLKMLKGRPESEVARHEDIANRLVEHCYDLGVNPVGLRGEQCVRLAKLLFTLGEDVDGRK